MSYMKMLSDTYDQNKQFIADYTRREPLCPISHMKAEAQIEITVDVEGNFHGAVTITDKKESVTVIPVTESSAGRSSGDAPHPLCDNLSYVAGDYEAYAPSKKEAASAKGRFEQYIKALADWRNSLYADQKIEGVYRYIEKRCMIADLVKSGVVNLDETEKLSKEKIAGRTYDKCIVRFRILGAGNTSECWKDKELMEKYQKHYKGVQERQNRSDLCYLTGEYDVISDNHPKGILSACYGAKLLSANDMTDFTFRGRFSTGEEAYAVSYEATQKSHNALKWLAKEQGYVVGASDKRTYICWDPKGRAVIRAGEDFGYPEDEEDIIPTTRSEYKEKLGKTINGYRNRFDETDDIALIALEAATTGRLSVVYYNELKAKDFFDCVRGWNESCCWQFTTFDKIGTPRQEVLTPSIKKIAEYSFGMQQGDYVKVSDKLMIVQYQRLFHCIVDKQRLPRDFVNAIFQRSSRLLTYSRGNRERLLSTACALIAKFYFDEKGEKIEMEVDRNNNDRSYLYGRLLAVYEKVERSTYGKDERREPNAIRFQSAYTQHPATTRMIIEKALLPYYQRLKPETREFYRREVEEISNMIGIDSDNRSLGYMYIIGYWAERAYLRFNKEEEK